MNLAAAQSRTVRRSSSGPLPSKHRSRTASPGGDPPKRPASSNSEGNGLYANVSSRRTSPVESSIFKMYWNTTPITPNYDKWEVMGTVDRDRGGEKVSAAWAWLQTALDGASLIAQDKREAAAATEHP